MATEYVSTICADSATAVGVFTPLTVKLDLNSFLSATFYITRTAFLSIAVHEMTKKFPPLNSF